MIKHIHSSGRYDRSPASVARAVRQYAKVCNLITLTEMQDRERSNALKMDGWTVTKFYGPGDGDPALVSKDSDWIVIQKWSHQLSKYEQRRGPGGPRPPHSLTVLLRHRESNKKLLVSVVHLPSHVEGNWFDRFYWRVFVWKDCHKHWKENMIRLRRSHNAKVMMVADWNLNFKRLVFRRLVKRLHPDLTLTWRKPFPRGGTHKRRIIDATLTNLRVLHKARLIEDDASSDHRPYREVLFW